MTEQSKLHHYKTQMPGLEWPAMPSGSAAYTMALLLELEDSQWWPQELLLQRQFRQLESLLAHAYQQIPYYRQKLNDCGYQPGDKLTAENFRAIPTLKRKDVLALDRQLDAKQYPEEHGKTHTIRTSGSTGQPVTIRRTAIALRMIYAISLRAHRWHNHDFLEPVATIRHFPDDPPKPPDGMRFPSWGDPVSPLFESGEAWCLDIRSNASEQLDWCRKINPGYLVTTPSVAESMALLSLRRGIRLERLRQVRTMGETVSESLRETVSKAWGVGVTDTYSSNEVGHLAIQMPDSDKYFVPQEHVYIELLNDKDLPVAPGETGRVIVTPMLNFATPLIRYEMGDYAELGTPSSCGRGLTVWNRIFGRTRNMLVLPDGDRRFASFGVKSFNIEHGDRVQEYQFIQRSTDSLDLSLVMDSPFNAEEELALIDFIRNWVKFPFTIKVTYVKAIARTGAGKFEVFRTDLA